MLIRDGSIPAEMKSTFPIGARATNDASYGIIMGRFAPCVVLINIFNKRMKNIPIDEDKLWTVSDEAFLYVAIENAYARWADMLLRKHAHARDPTVSLESDVRSLYTLEGGNTRQGRFKGWTAEGVQRYSEIHDIIEQDRSNNVGVYHEWARNQQPKNISVENRTVRDRALGDVDVPTDSFWEHMGAPEIPAPADDDDLFLDEPGEDQVNHVQI